MSHTVRRQLFSAASSFCFPVGLSRLMGSCQGWLSRRSPLSLQRQSWWTARFWRWEWRIVWIHGFVSLAMQRSPLADVWERFKMSPFISCVQSRNRVGLLCYQHMKATGKQILTQCLSVIFWCRCYSLALAPLQLWAVQVRFPGWLGTCKRSRSLLTKVSQLLDGSEHADGKYAHTQRFLFQYLIFCWDTGWLQLKSYLWQLWLPQSISVHTKPPHSFSKGVNYCLRFTYFHGHSQLITSHCLKGKWTPPNHFLSLQKSLCWLITMDPLKDLDI